MNELEEILQDYIEEYQEIEYPGQEKRYHVVFNEGRSVVFNRLLRRVRNAGFQVYAFGNNRIDHPNRITATFVEE